MGGVLIEDGGGGVVVIVAWLLVTWLPGQNRVFVVCRVLSLSSTITSSWGWVVPGNKTGGKARSRCSGTCPRLLSHCSDCSICLLLSVCLVACLLLCAYKVLKKKKIRWLVRDEVENCRFSLSSHTKLKKEKKQGRARPTQQQRPKGA